MMGLTPCGQDVELNVQFSGSETNGGKIQPGHQA